MTLISLLKKLFLQGHQDLLRMRNSIFAIALPQCFGYILTQACNEDRMICGEFKPPRNRPKKEVEIQCSSLSIE
jgi:hypothetical protein